MIDERMVIQQLLPWRNTQNKKKEERNKYQAVDTHTQYHMPPHRSNEEEKSGFYAYSSRKMSLANPSSLSSFKVESMQRHCK
jgi:hypothetical protein